MSQLSLFSAFHDSASFTNQHIAEDESALHSVRFSCSVRLGGTSVPQPGFHLGPFFLTCFITLHCILSLISLTVLASSLRFERSVFVFSFDYIGHSFLGLHRATLESASHRVRILFFPFGFHDSRFIIGLISISFLACAL